MNSNENFSSLMLIKSWEDFQGKTVEEFEGQF